MERTMDRGHGQGPSADRVNKRKVKKEKKFKLFSIRSGLDMPFLCLVLILLGIGLVMMFSASHANAYYLYGDSYMFIKNQGIFAIIGVVIMLLVSFFDYHHFHKLAIPILLVSWALLALVLVLPAIKGVHRWIRIPGVGQFQPSEIMKFALIVSFAHFISINYKKMQTFKTGVLPYMIILGITILLLYKEPHISACVIMVLLSAAMLFVGGIKLRWFGLVIGVVAAGLLYMVLFASDVAYASDRINAWLNPFSNETEQLIADTWQTRQSLYAIGSGGWLGVGIGQSRQKYLYLPEPQNDFAFAIVVEELGFIGGAIILVIFALLVWRGIVIALAAKDKFGMLLGVGLSAQVAIQVILNICVICNTVPNTGISLPFFSYGGTSLVIILAQMGIILSISRSANIEKM